MNIFLSAWDAFNNPDSPWYYVVAIIFLVLIFGALALYMVYAKKRKKTDEKKETADTDNAETNAEARSEENTDGQKGVSANEDAGKPNDEVKEQATEKLAEKETEKATDDTVEADRPKGDEDNSASVETESPTVEEEKKTAEKTETAEKAEEPAATEKTEKAATVEKAEEPVADKTEQKPKAKRNASTAKKTPGETTAKAVQKKTAAKPFIDRLIDERSVHSIYNEIKNTILSYPGVKAKLNKDGEDFFFGEEKKASVALDDGKIKLYLYVDPTTVPEQFGIENVGGELPTMLSVSEEKIDGAQKLIFFAMNVAMLTRNASRRYVDYVQNAINAKNRAKKK